MQEVIHYFHSMNKGCGMNIDLLFTQDGEAGLIASDIPVKKIAGVLLDTQSGLMSFEYADMDHLELNIPIDAEFFSVLDGCSMLHIGSYKNEHIAQAYQIPLMFLDDPYRGDMLGQAQDHPMPLTAFGQFIKRCIAGQPVHRDDLGDDDAMGCILGDAVPSALQFAPHLVRRLGMEAKPSAQPSGPGPSAPGLGGGSSSGGGRSYFQPKDDGSDE